MKWLTDNPSVYYLLEKAGAVFPGFDSDRVTAFDLEEDFYIVFYTAGERSLRAFVRKITCAARASCPRCCRPCRMIPAYLPASAIKR